MRTALALLLVVAPALLAGCTGSPEPAAVDRDGLPFAVVSSVAGVPPNAAGDLGFGARDGVEVVANATSSSVTVGLGPLVAWPGVLQACRGACEPHEATDGIIIAEGSLVTLANLSLNALGPEGDSVVFFYEDGDPTGEFLRWRDRRAAFQLSNHLEVEGEIAARGRIGTTTLFPGSEDGTRGPLEVATAALEALEGVVVLRGSGALENGTAVMRFPPHYSVLIGDGPISAFVTLTSRGPPLYVSEKSRDGVVVEAADGSSANATFDLLVIATRVGTERYVPVRQG